MIGVRTLIIGEGREGERGTEVGRSIDPEQPDGREGTVNCRGQERGTQ